MVEFIKIIIEVFALLFFLRYLVWMLSWYSYQHDARMSEDDILDFEHEYKKLVRDHQYREKKRSMQ